MRRFGATGLIVLGLFALIPAVTVAATRERGAEPAPAVFRDLVDCRRLADPATRLACFDKQVAALDQAAQARDVVIVDKAEVRAARKGLFGFKLPSLRLFSGGGAKGAEEPLTQIDAVIASARQVGYGEWRFTLEDGAVWEQTDSNPVVLDPHRGSKVVIRRGALGSFKANFDGQPGVKVRRIE